MSKSDRLVSVAVFMYSCAAINGRYDQHEMYPIGMFVAKSW